MFSVKRDTVRASLLQHVKAHKALLLNAISLMGTTAITSGLGFAYWWWAARQFPPAAVGLASAAISAMTLLGTLGILGLDTLLVGELPRQQGKAVPLIHAALLLVGGVGGCLGVLFAFVAPSLSNDFYPLQAGIGNILLFAAGVALTAITLVFDRASIGLFRGGIQLQRNTLFAVTKLVALFLVGMWWSHTTGLIIYATWVVGIALSLTAIVLFAAWKRELDGKNLLPHWALLQKLGPRALKHHLLNLTLLAPPLLLPVLVTVLLSATANAWFYVSWSIASIGNLVCGALTTVLYASNATGHSTLASKLRLTLSIAFVAILILNCVLLFDTQQVLGLFGQSYAQQAVWSLRILGLESFPFIIKNHYVALYRIQERVAYATLPTIAGGALELGASTLGAYLGGLSGLSLGWLSAVCIEAACMAYPVYKAARTGKSDGRRETCAS